MSAFAQTVITQGIKVIIALIALFVSFKLINIVSRKVLPKAEIRWKLDQTISRALNHAASIGLKILVTIALIGYLGIETSGISAVLASLGVTVGLAINGTISNLAGGIMLIITRPFKVGDFITAQGTDGTIDNIGICYTKLHTVDNKVIYLPNAGLSTGTVINYSELSTRRVDLDFSVGGNDPELVRKLLLSVIEKEPLVQKDPAPFVRMTDFGAGNGVKMTLRVWCKGSDYWDCYYNILDAAEKTFAENNINIPYSQLDVHIKNA